MDHSFYHDRTSGNVYHLYRDFYVVNYVRCIDYDDRHLPGDEHDAGAPAASSVLDHHDLHDLIDRAVDHYLDHGPGEYHYDDA